MTACPEHDENRWPYCRTCPGPRDRRRRLADLREAAIAASRGRCEWPYCDDFGAQMAHLQHRGMGGSRLADWIGNVAWLCAIHHDVLDGRTALGTLRFELNETLRGHLRTIRKAIT